ncbi:MAG TPA: 6,7-dimethyl-8-ribityllumazine synthase [Candidatus Akkermansia intestinigallinarum]|uniref:6,7-dimethyl-8-ribityllumazine synthase n=1 Tax=Candidatus Akkermansia intestinigallinarum TaxID=2838431 RepID=A0A9D2AHA6_9BACT|nr:6,7-dimethyl-8-ribityllumazine synthase [Candidatus Akkermansia intestinigallinarum]
MSTELPQRQQPRHGKGRITIVCATYNEKYTDALLQNCLDELEAVAPLVRVSVVRVPGAFEVPLMVKRSICGPGVSDDNRPDAVIALGVILRGSTAHADLIGSSITQQLMSIGCDTLVPVIHEVLLLNDEQQAFARCIASTLNRGREAARAAVAMLEVIDAPRVGPLRHSPPRRGTGF